MSEWIESHAALRDHPKLKKLARLLKIERQTAVGYLHYLWWWAMDYAPDGDLARYEDADVADALDWAGDPGELMDALRASGFVDGTILHDWQDYGEKLHRRRKANAERMRAAREKGEDDTCAARAAHVQDTSVARGQTDRQDRQTGQTVGATAAALVALAQEKIPKWKPKDRDEAVMQAGIDLLGEEAARRVVLKLACEQTAKMKYTDLQRTLSAWFKTEKPPAKPPTPPPKAEPKSFFASEEERALFEQSKQTWAT